MKFQSLGRDSVGLDYSLLGLLWLDGQVSIPRSGFCWFGLLQIPQMQGNTKLVSIPRSGFCWFGPMQPKHIQYRLGIVSIPRSGFCWFGHISGEYADLIQTCFNPSVGILLVWTATLKAFEAEIGLFQSLGRDSVGLDRTHEIQRVGNRPVSIPRSGFCWFGPRLPAPSAGQYNVSIPRSGFCWFGLPKTNPIG